MILFERTIGAELAYYRALAGRGRLSGEDAKHLSVQKKDMRGNVNTTGCLTRPVMVLYSCSEIFTCGLREMLHNMIV